MRTIFKWLIPAVIIIIVLYLINPTLWGLLGQEQQTAEAPTASFNTNIPVSAVILNPRSIDNKITVTGSIAANEEVELRSEVSGFVTRILFKEGSRVR